MRAKCVLTELNLHFLGETREFFERFKFNQRSQEAGESVEQYVTLDNELVDLLLYERKTAHGPKLLMTYLGVRDDRMREQMMATPDLTLSKAIDICKAVEATATQMKALKQEEMVHKLDKKQFPTASQPHESLGNYAEREGQRF